ncbi:MAG: hypothetical protein JXA14_20215, partial [Anaerolineae bacterium]|nr:hypothetical protein [Anaerolineae bacterium]
MTISDKLSQLLLSVVSIARESETQTISCANDPGYQKGTFDCKVERPLTGEVVVVGEGVREDPITVLEEYGFVRRTGPNSLILLPAAFDFAEEHQLLFEPSSLSERKPPMRNSVRFVILRPQRGRRI